MSTTEQRVPRVIRLLQTLLLAAALVVGTTACSDNETSGSSSSASDAGKAKTTLDAGLKAHSSGDLTKASQDYRKTLQLDPGNKFAYYNLALIDAASGNYGLAEDKYRAALETDPRYEPALFNLAILRTPGDPKEAISLYRRAVAADPKAAPAWLNLGLLLRASGQKAEGNKDVLKAIALNPHLKDPAKQ